MINPRVQEGSPLRQDVARWQAHQLATVANLAVLDARAAKRSASALVVEGSLIRPGLTTIAVGRHPVAIAKRRLIVHSSMAEKIRDHLAVPVNIVQRDGCVVAALETDDPDISLLDLRSEIAASGERADLDVVTPCGPLKRSAGNTPEQPPADVVPGEMFTRCEASDLVRIAIIDTGLHVAAKGFGGLFNDVVASNDNRDWLTVINQQQGAGTLLDDAAGHGTFVAGIARQIAADVDVVIYRALDTDGLGTDEAIGCAIERAIVEFESDRRYSGNEKRRLIINLSLGVSTLNDRCPLAMALALDHVDPRFHAVVAAAGNERTATPLWPAADPRVLAVGSVTSDLRPSAFTNFGWWVDFSLCGEGVVSSYVPGVENSQLDSVPETYIGDSPWATWTGTSFSSPQLAALLAVQASRSDSMIDAIDRLRGDAVGTLKGLGHVLVA
jgi:hypothetical protein